jgi:hypothetical protein
MFGMEIVRGGRESVSSGESAHKRIQRRRRFPRWDADSDIVACRAGERHWLTRGG